MAQKTTDSNKRLHRQNVSGHTALSWHAEVTVQLTGYTKAIDLLTPGQMTNSSFFPGILLCAGKKKFPLRMCKIKL